MKILQIIKIIKIMARFLLLSLLVLGLGIYSGCGSDGTGTGAGGPGGAGGGGAAAPPPLLATVYVDGSASDGGDGSSWTKAFKDLQAGIDAAAEDGTVYVAVGTYKPTSRPNGGAETDPRTVHFTLKNKVEVNGGYKKGMDGEYRVVRLGENTPDADKTILSGDLGDNDTANMDENKDDNVYHVFYHPGGLDETAKLFNVTITKANAVTITKANANDSVYNDDGGGMHNRGSSPSLDNVTFKDNKATDYGGGMFNANKSNPTLKDVTFTGNRVSITGGGMYNEYSSPILTDVTFSNNTSNKFNGGGMANIGGSPILTNVNFTSNTAQSYGGGMYNIGGSPKLNDVTFSGNQAQDGGGVYNRTTSNPSLTGCTFTGNTATNAGGAMYSDNTSTPNFADNPLTPTTDALASQTNGYYKAP